MLDEQGFLYHGTGAAGTGEPGDCRQHMQKKDGQLAHRTMLSRSRHGRRMLRNFGIRHRQAIILVRYFVRLKIVDPSGSISLGRLWAASEPDILRRPQAYSPYREL